MEVEDLLRDPLVGVLGRDEEDEHDRERRRAPRRAPRAPEPRRERPCYSVTTYSKDAQRQYREDRVVQAEEGEVAARVGRDARADAADDERDRERQEEQRQDQLARRGSPPPSPRAACRRRRCRRSRAATPSDRRRVERREEERERGQRDELDRRRGRRRRAADLPSQIALRSDGASTSPSSAPPSRSGAQARASPSSAVKTSATQSSPCAAHLVRAGRQREVEDDERREDEEHHRRQRVARAQLEPQILARERGDVGEVASRERQRERVASGSTPLGLVGREQDRAPCRRARRAARSSSSAPSASSAVNGSSRTSSSGSCRSARQSASRCVIPREYDADALGARVPEPEALEQHPDPLAPLRARGRAGRRGRGSRARSGRGRGAARGRGSRARRAPASTVELATASARRARRRGRSSVVLPEPFGPVTTRKPPALELGRSSGRSTRRRP